MNRNFLLWFFMLTTLLMSAVPGKFGKHEQPTITEDRCFLVQNTFIWELLTSNAPEQGSQIIAQLFSADDQLKSTCSHKPDSNITLVFPDASIDDYVKIQWLDSNQVELCPPLLLSFRILKTNTWEETAEATIFMSRFFENTVSVRQPDGAFASGRLIAKYKETYPDLLSFPFRLMILDHEDHLFIQFSSDTDAKKCADYLESLPCVIYVEPDSKISLDPEPMLSGDYTAISSDALSIG